MVENNYCLKLKLREVDQWVPCDKASGTPHGEIWKENWHSRSALGRSKLHHASTALRYRYSRTERNYITQNFWKKLHLEFRFVSFAFKSSLFSRIWSSKLVENFNLNFMVVLNHVWTFPEDCILASKCLIYKIHMHAISGPVATLVAFSHRPRWLGLGNNK